MRARQRLNVVASLVLCAAACSAPPTNENPREGVKELVPTAAGQRAILIFSRTAAFRHDSIPAGIQAIAELGRQNGFGVSSTEDATKFADAELAPFAAIVFLSTTGDVLDDTQQAAFERYIQSGGAYVGVHAAADCEYEWPFYGELAGAYFAGHSQIVAAEVKSEGATHPAVTGLPSPWSRTDEWYGFRENPRSAVTVLLTVDESSYDPGPGMMGADHPIAWSHELQGRRAFYTALGHTQESFKEPAFLQHLLGGIQWAAGLLP